MNRPRDEYDAGLDALLGGRRSDDPDGYEQEVDGWDAHSQDAGDRDVGADGPADVSPEYLEAWRRGYEQARRQSEAGEDTGPPTGRGDFSGTAAREDTAPPDGRDDASRSTPRNEAGRTAASSLAAPDGGHERTAVVELGGGPPPPYDEGREHQDERSRRPLLLVGVVLVSLLLVLGAYGLGRLFAGDPAETSAASQDEEATSQQDGGGGEAGEKSEPYEGAVDAVEVAGSTATCQAEGSVDAAGNPTSYQPALAHDSDLTTAWRCDGRGKGQRLTINLPEETAVAEVGLVPGYAKTDPASGVDRYAENNRITRVRWRFEDGTSVVQKMSGAANDRSMRTLRVPETSTGSVVLEILASKAGPRNTVAVSEVRVATPAG